MSLQRFQRLVERCEALASRSPGAYRFRVAMLAVLGIAVVLALLLGSLATVIAVIAVVVVSKQPVLIKLAVVPIGFSLLVMRALWMRLAPPEGVEVTRKSAPALFSELASIRQELRSLPVHRVVVAPDAFNAAVVQIPRLGPFGWPSNHLILGLPLLEALTVPQLRAVLGHELGHLSRKQSRFRNWIYRSRQTWERLSAVMSTRGGLSAMLVGPFLKWYGPYFNAYTFVLARANEFDADRAAAAVSSAELAGGALTAVSVKSQFLEEKFWGDLSRRALSDPTAPAEPFRDYLGHLRNLPALEADSALQKALSAQTSTSDTHPCLADRLRALGQQPVPPGPVAVSAGEALLGPLRETLIARTDLDWAGKIAPRWKVAHEEGAARQARIDQMTPNAATFNARDMLEYATLLAQNDHAAEARPWLDAVLAREPDHAVALFMRGRMRLADGDESGVADIDRCMQLDKDAIEPGSQLLLGHFHRRRNAERSQVYLDNLDRIEAMRAADGIDRGRADRGDTFVGHGLAPEHVQLFASACAGDRKIKRAWLARKETKHFPEKPLFVLVVDYGYFGRPKQAQLDAIVAAMPNVDRLVLVRKQAKAVARKIERVAGSMIHERA